MAVRAELQAIIAGAPKATVRDFAGHLGKLALHYWRPDFTPDQAKLMYGDFVHDLDGVTSLELERACAAWRTDPTKEFYPKPGGLLALVKDGLADRARARMGAEYLLGLLVEEKPAGDAGVEFDAAARLHALGEQMRVKTGGARPVAAPEPERPPVMCTARAETDAGELLGHLNKRTGTQAA